VIFFLEQLPVLESCLYLLFHGAPSGVEEFDADVASLAGGRTAAVAYEEARFVSRSPAGEERQRRPAEQRRHGRKGLEVSLPDG
jgi:hypothetical protein